MQLASAYQPPNTQLWPTLWTGLVAIVAGLLSDVVASHVTPTLQQRTGLTVTLFAVVSIAGVWLAIYREYGSWLPLPAMVPALDSSAHRQLVTILLPLIEHEADRRALLRLALGNDPCYNQITFTGANEAFLSNMLDVLVRRGEVTKGNQAVWALLEVVSSRVGFEQQARIEALRPVIAALSQSQKRLPQQVLAGFAKLVGKKFKPLPVAIFLILAVFVALGSPLVTTAYAQTVDYCLPDHICVFIAQFTPVENEEAKSVTEELYSQLNDVLQSTVPERFTLHKVVIAEEARADEMPEQIVTRLARERGALLIVWGDIVKLSDGQSNVNVKYHLTDLMGVGEASATQPYRAVPLRYNTLKQACSDCFSLETSQQTQIVTYASAGLFHYMRHRPRIARHAFEAALYCADELDGASLGDIVPSCTPSRPPLDWSPGLLYYYRGKTFYLEGDFPNALANLELAAHYNIEDPAAFIGIAAVYQGWLGDSYPSDPLVKQALAEAKARATTLFANTTMMVPSVLYDLGFIHEVAGETEYAEAQDRYREAADAFSSVEFKAQGQSSYISLIALARVQQMAGDRESAQRTLQEAIGVDPDLAWAYIGMAQAYEDDPSIAKSWLRKAEARVDIFDGAVDLAVADLCQSEKWQDEPCAAAALQRVLDKWPYSGNLFSLAGDFYRSVAEKGGVNGEDKVEENWENARKVYAKAAEQLRPNDPWAHERLAYVLFRQGNYAESARQYQQVVALAYSSTYVPDGVYCMMAIAQENGGEIQLALDSYRYCLNATTDPVRKLAAQEKVEQLQGALNK